VTPDTLAILRCPYCGGRLELVESLFHRLDGDAIQDGVLGCQCCVFPIVDGIPVLHLQPRSTRAREQIEAGRPESARRTMFGLDDERADAFDRVAASELATYRDTVQALGPNFEGGYFLFRFSDPTFVVAEAVVKSVAAAVLDGDGRAIDMCGGSGHLTRALLDLSSARPVLADLYFAKVWLARRFTAPGCEPVCCDANAPLPFARGAFRFAMCADAFMYIWTKRQFVGEMERLVDARVTDAAWAHGPGAVVIAHTHNQNVWSPSHGQTLTPEGYAALFETTEPRLFGEAGLFADLIGGGPADADLMEERALDLCRRDPAAVLDRDPALTIIATRHPDVFKRHRIGATPPVRARGEFCLNPLYTAERDGPSVGLRLRFPDGEYEQEYGACRQYLPAEVSVESALLDTLPTTVLPPGLVELARRRVILDLPVRYY
jgi:uncharacterized protein YbaR (Trm112 family)